MTRPDRSKEMDQFLHRTGWHGATRAMLAGDASFRRYERVRWNDTIAVLMDAPPPWEDVRPFVAVTELLTTSGVSVPAILAADADEGFLLLEDLGDSIYTRLLKADATRETEFYHAAVDALVAIHRASQHHRASFAQALKPYDEAVYLREAALFVEWFLPQVVGMESAHALRDAYREAWRAVLANAPLKRTTLVHRDYHADNLLWLADREGHRAVGMLDYQDALWGDPAYDLVSLLEDARRDVGAHTAYSSYARFLEAMGEEPSEFAERYAILGAQRNAKIIGIFTRLCVRDGKPHYLDYLPRVWAHFEGDLKHPALAPVKAFVDAHVPGDWRGTFRADTSIGGMAA